MSKWILISILMMIVAVGTLTATGPDAKTLAQKGYDLFKDVIAGDEAKLPEAIRYMEEAREADGAYVPNLFNLARAYFFEAMTFDRNEPLVKAEKTFARVVELDPGRTDAMAFHGAILVQMSGGRDMAMFMRGAQELKAASERTPDDVTVRIVIGFVSQSVPPEALALIGVTDPVKNMTFVGNVFDRLSSDFAPHASVVMNAFIGETLLKTGDKERARTAFERALKAPQPVEDGQLVARKRLDDAIAARMNGGARSIFNDSNFSGCHSCHLAAPDKLLSGNQSPIQ